MTNEEVLMNSIFASAVLLIFTVQLQKSQADNGLAVMTDEEIKKVFWSAIRINGVIYDDQL